MTDKKALRTEMAARRAAVHGKVDASPALKNLTRVLGRADHPISFYWPIRTEIDPRPVLKDFATKGPVCLPVTTGYAPLLFCQWTPDAAMETDGFGVSVPVATPEMLPRTLVIPLLSFDPLGQRLGYGAGHYDRTLERLRALHPVRAIGFAYAAQQCARVPTEPTDQPLDMIVTEAGIISGA
ncbi:5-formyltetrahydrofolate cyclo-ligase [Rhodobacteraceae bacterium]|nr:5-formyltetrahydrofolate cyclo-ligase [Paracoccaceae bacterium]